MTDLHVAISTPLFIPLPTAAIQDERLPAPLFRSYARLYASAWGNSYCYAGPLDFESELAPLLGVRRSQVLQQLRLLHTAGLIDWERDNRGHYTIFFMRPTA